MVHYLSPDTLATLSTYKGNLAICFITSNSKSSFNNFRLTVLGNSLPHFLNIELIRAQLYWIYGAESPSKLKAASQSNITFLSFEAFNIVNFNAPYAIASAVSFL
jgi:hypothetical protein